MRSRSARAFVAVALGALVTGCEESLIVEEDPDEAPPSIDAELVLQTSEWVGASRVSEARFRFDVSSLELFDSAEFDEIEIGYRTTDACDRDISVFDQTSATWPQVGFELQGVFCASIPSVHHHTVSDLGIAAVDVVGSTGEILVESSEALPDRVRLLKLTEGYSAVRTVTTERVSTFSGLAFDGVAYWLSSRFKRLHRVTPAGELLFEMTSPGPFPNDLAYGGDHLWLADGSDRIFKLDRAGEFVDEFTVPTDFPGGLAWGDSSLWLAEYEGADPKYFEIDPEASCASGSAVILATRPTPGGGCRGLAWDGSELLVASDSLYVVGRGGGVLASYAHPVDAVTAIAWDGHAVALLCRGPAGIGGSGQKRVRFTLPDSR